MAYALAATVSRMVRQMNLIALTSVSIPQSGTLQGGSWAGFCGRVARPRSRRSCPVRVHPGGRLHLRRRWFFLTARWCTAASTRLGPPSSVAPFRGSSCWPRPTSSMTTRRRCCTWRVCSSSARTRTLSLETDVSCFRRLRPERPSVVCARSRSARPTLPILIGQHRSDISGR